MRRSCLVCIVVLLLAALSGCLPFIAPSPDQGPVTPTVTPTDTPTPTLTPEPPSPELPEADKLSLWVPVFLAEHDEEDGASVLESLVAAYVAQETEFEVEIVARRDQGTGGLYQLLSAAYDVAPAIVPDLIVLHQSDLRAAIAGGYVQPVPVNMGYQRDDFYDFALAPARIGEADYAIPLITAVDHLAYRADFSDTPPFTWTEVLTAGYRIVLPAAPADGLADHSVLSAYIGSGGSVMDEEGRPVLERTDLEALYRFVQAMVEAELLDADEALNLPDANACWTQFLAGRATLSPVPFAVYWQDPPEDTLPTWMPTVTGQPMAVAQSWFIAIVAKDPVRQAEAMRLALWLTRGDSMDALARAVQKAPTRRAALLAGERLPGEAEFLDRLLEAAISIPSTTVDTAVRRALQAGLGGLLRQELATPEEAAAYALTTLRQ